MKAALRTFLFSTLCAATLYAQDSAPAAAPPYYRVRYEPSTAPDGLIFGVSYTVWIPPGVKTLRGVIVHQHGCGEGSCKSGLTAAFDLQWQALARKHECALLGPSYEQPEKAVCSMWCDPRNGSEQAFLKALSDLGSQSRHPELATVPWALWGHSGGANWVGNMLALHPDRIAAAWLRSGTPRVAPRDGSSATPAEMPDASCKVPTICNLGTREGVTEKDPRFGGLWPNVQKFFGDLRARGALIGVAVDPNSSHDCGNQRYIAIPWFDACLSARLPDRAGEATLKPMPTDGAWLAAQPPDAPEPAVQFKGDAKTAIWLPNEHVAKVWAEYEKDGNVKDSTPPPAPMDVKLAGNELTWNAEADLESGLAGFIIERDGKELARLPDKPPARLIGRAIFQKNGYSDSPTPPLAEMRFTDSSAVPGEKHTYSVIAINSTGLVSTPAKTSP
jgi:poly(3-hydroxybutyrate) depolymerase